MEKNFLEMPFLEQIYLSRKEDVEQTIYDNEKEIQKIEGKSADLNDELLKLLEKVIPKKEDYTKVKEKLKRYDLAIKEETYFWGKTYYKLGINDMYKLKNELDINSNTIRKGKTFLDCADSELDEYIQSKIDLNSDTYKKYKEKYNEIAEKYPNVLNVYEDSTPIVLNIEEMKKLMELKELDTKVRAEEIKVCFKAGMNEILNF